MFLSTKYPLYEQFLNKDTKDEEYLDLESINWIADKTALSKKKYLTIEDILSISKFFPKREYFISESKYKAIHGVMHISRVLINTKIICSKLRLSNIDTELALICAAIHDIRRQSDKDDIGHGKRSFLYFEDNLNKFNNYYKLSNIEYYLQNKSIVEFVVTNHETNYIDIKNYDQRTPKEKFFLDILKAADALDRYRLPKEKFFPKKEYINLKASHSLLTNSKNLTIFSEFLNKSGVEEVKSLINSAYIAVCKV